MLPLHQSSTAFHLALMPLNELLGGDGETRTLTPCGAGT